MDLKKIESEYRKFQKDNEGFGNLIILDKEGKILFTTESTFITDDDGKTLMDVWLNHKPAVTIKGDRFPVLSWEELQFAARNVKGKGAIIGCKTKSNSYAIVHLEPKCRAQPAIAAIKLNRWSWDLI